MVQDALRFMLSAYCERQWGERSVAGSPLDYRKLNSGLVRAAALQAAGGDLESLRPAEGGA